MGTIYIDMLLFIFTLNFLTAVNKDDILICDYLEMEGDRHSGHYINNWNIHHRVIVFDYNYIARRQK
jgi:hypothetical protein